MPISNDRSKRKQTEEPESIDHLSMVDTERKGQVSSPEKKTQKNWVGSPKKRKLMSTASSAMKKVEVRFELFSFLS